MWAVNTVLTTRVYMNLVWLAKKPLIEASQHELSSAVPTGGGIRLRVHTLTEVRSDTWKPTNHFEGGLYSMPAPDMPSDRTPSPFTP
jgi:hypothetical protein